MYKNENASLVESLGEVIYHTPLQLITRVNLIVEMFLISEVPNDGHRSTRTDYLLTESTWGLKIKMFYFNFYF
jgi:hypothetical protein